jgi:hypothetical protein
MKEKHPYRRSYQKKKKHDPWNAGPEDDVQWDCTFCGIKSFSPEKDMFEHWRTCEKARAFFAKKRLIRGPVYKGDL